MIFFSENKPLKGKKALVTAGPTYEKIDPVRFIGNFSSGKMGFHLAEKLAEMGAEVQLITGPSALHLRNHSVDRKDVISAEEMMKAVMAVADSQDIIIMAAAVADYSVANQQSSKIKRKSGENLTLELIPTQDILAAVGKKKKENQLLIGFALETNNELLNAEKKLKNKNLSFIVLNSLNDEGAGFGTDTNKITIISDKGEINKFELRSKDQVATDIINTCILRK